MGKPKIIKVNPDNPDAKSMKEAAGIVNSGGLVAFPTETVYGLAAAYNNKSALDKLYKVKNRPKNKPFTVHISSMDTIGKLGCDISPVTRVLVEKFWPGPLTIVLKVKDKEDTIAFRMPRGRIAKDLIDKSGVPIVAPSANMSGGKSPKTAEEVIDALNGTIDAVIDGGPTEIGVDSTIVDATGFPYRIIREGAIPAASIMDAWQHE